MPPETCLHRVNCKQGYFIKFNTVALFTCVLYAKILLLQIRNRIPLKYNFREYLTFMEVTHLDNL